MILDLIIKKRMNNLKKVNKEGLKKDCADLSKINLIINGNLTGYHIELNSLIKKYPNFLKNIKKIDEIFQKEQNIETKRTYCFNNCDEKYMDKILEILPGLKEYRHCLLKNENY